MGDDVPITASTAITDSAPTPPTPCRVLIAEDMFDSRDLLARVVQQYLHCTIHLARNGQEALNQFALVKPQLVLLDIDMPEVDGMKALADIRAMDPTACVVMVSAIGSLAAVKQALGFGVAGFVVKPFSAQRVYDVLKRFAESTGNPALLRGD